MNFVSECTTTSAPCSIGRNKYGEAIVLSTMSGKPCLRAISLIFYIDEHTSRLARLNEDCTGAVV